MPEQTRLKGVVLNGESIGELDPVFDTAPGNIEINIKTINNKNRNKEIIDN